jgi:hypothetical protein
VVVAGPTLDDSYTAAFGSVPKPDHPICAFYTLADTTAPITVASVAVDGPVAAFMAVTSLADCEPWAGSGLAGPVCQDGVALAAGPQATDPEAPGCWFGIALGPAADTEQNYEDEYSATVTFSAVCTEATEGPVCGDGKVTEKGPSPSSPVPVTVRVTTPLRYCGLTDYDDGAGVPVSDPSDTTADNGCL